MWATMRFFLFNVIYTLICLFFVRIFIIYLRIHDRKRSHSRAPSFTTKIMIVLGSGGHTFEMLRLVKNMTERYRPRIYVLADTDKMSEKKVIALENSQSVQRQDDSSDLYVFEKIPRSREVQQSWITSVVSTLYACIYSLPVLLRHKPDVIICNGPGTCVPICVVAFLSHVVGLKHIKVIYIESICRVETMSLTGKILYPIADDVLVQWPQLRSKYPRAKYFGRLV